jgi:gas vesicle protein
MSTTNFLAGAIAGLTTGIVIGLLTAPDTGEGTRKKIKHKADNLRHKLGKLVGKGSDDLSELKHVFENEVTGLKDDVRERVLRLIDESQGTYNKFKNEALS